MHASSAIIGMSAFAVAALAQTQSSAIQFNSFPPQNVVPGQSIPLKYTAPDANSPATIVLLSGCPGNCVSQSTVTTAATGGLFTWTPSGVPGGCGYGLQIIQNGVMNYSNNFCIAGPTSSSAVLAPTTYANAPSSAAAPVSQKTDGQPQAATSAAAAGPGAQSTYRGYGAASAATPTPVRPSPSPKYTGAAGKNEVGLMGLAGVAGLVALL